MRTKELNLEEARTYLSHAVEADLRGIIENKGYGTMVLTGGRSIQTFLPYLQKMNLPWEKLILLLSDDRLISSNGPDSNEYMIREKFLNKEFINENLLYLSIKEAYFRKKREEYKFIEKSLEHSVMILSMGVDGHMASLFSKKDTLDDKETLTHVLRPDFERVSLSYSALMLGKRTYIIVYGKEKIDYLNQLDVHQFYLKDLLMKSTVILVHDNPVL